MTGISHETIRIVPPLDPEDDQTFGYFPDGEPVTADQQTTVWPTPNMLTLHAMKANVEFTGKNRQKTVGEPRHLAKQPRRAELVLGLDDERGDMSMHSVKPNRFPQAEHQLSIALAPQVIGFSNEQRRLTTALKKRHTRSHWQIQKDAGDIGGVQKLGLGGFQSPVEGTVYRHQRTLVEQQDQQRNAQKPPAADDVQF